MAMLTLRVLRSGPLHGYAIAQRIRQLSDSVLGAEEGSLYPTLQRLRLEGWVKAGWGISETNRRVRFYSLTAAGLWRRIHHLVYHGRLERRSRCAPRPAISMRRSRCTGDDRHAG